MASPQSCSYIGDPTVGGQLKQLFTVNEVIPEDWLLGVILPFWKKGPKDVCSNYRGITLLSVPGKVFANVILARLRPLLIRKQRKEQSGFTPGRSTVDRILTLRLLAEKRREFRKPFYAAYVDLKQAFDSVDRPAL
ncbi:Hypp3468 [Branchiostoma lanceolatum]|uniref:Hypp3468 protein n=1 Tax=Branchiostoma lanceolatum TaxID=7740 RepID=A0A8K0ES41_BRALA|nr:Hypp3468 [Branchiostoma lanceolatum]